MISQKRIIEIIFFLFSGMLIFLLYYKTLNGPFILDDWWNIVENEKIRLTELSIPSILDVVLDSGGSANRPIAMLSFALNYLVHQYKLPGYHIFNICVHLINGILLYYFIRLTLSFAVVDPRIREKSIWIAMASSIVWLIHPIQTQSVSYIVQRMNSLATMFFLLSMISYIRARKSEKFMPLWWTAVFLTAVLALLSKQNAATLPIFIILYEWYFYQKTQIGWIKRNKLVIAVAATSFVILAILFLRGNPLDTILSGYQMRDFTLTQRILTELRVVCIYITKLLFPHPTKLSLEHDILLSNSLFDPLTTISSAGILAVILFLAFYLYRKEPVVSFSIFWFLGNLVIESTVIPLELIFEHRTYLPSMMFPLIFIILATKTIKPFKVKATLLALTIIVLSFWTFERNNVWHDTSTLWSDTVNKAPLSSRAQINYAKVLYLNGDNEQAMLHVSEALRLKPDKISAVSLYKLIKKGIIFKKTDGGYHTDASLTKDALIKKYSSYLDNIEMVPIPAGCFQMGDILGKGNAEEQPVHEVCVNNFQIGKYEVTQGLWQAVMGYKLAPYASSSADLPVESVSWLDVQVFLEELKVVTQKNYRLPTEAEWEYACRGGGAEIEFCGSTNADSVAWYDENSGGAPNPVGLKKGNGLDIYDMSGNVWEWCNDRYEKGYYRISPRDNPQGPATGNQHIIRGGSWDSGALGVRSSARFRVNEGKAGTNLGFRLVLSVEQQN